MCTDPNSASLSTTNDARPFVLLLAGCRGTGCTRVPVLSHSLRTRILSQHLLVLALLTPEASHLPLDEDTPTYSQSLLLQ